ncbi:MAG: metal-dependent hydrolase [Chitinophagales bacterium]|nr:metal-dependent hydrolase [Chitinophagales bacterium]
MFIGHYALGFSGKRIDKGPSLGTMFLAVQWLDLVWPFLVLAGVEKVSIDPGNTVLTPLNFESYPWSHSMLMALGWGILFAIIYFARTKNRRGSLLLFFLVFSHWVLDFVTHRPDLQLTPFADTRVGLGLWNYKWVEVVIETALFIAGIYIYSRLVKAKNKTGQWALWSLIAFLVAVHFMNVFGPPPPSVEMVAWAGLSQWLLVAWGYWIDNKRL